jgi:hypothetical protein
MSKNENLNDFSEKTLVLEDVTIMLSFLFFVHFFCDDIFFIYFCGKDLRKILLTNYINNGNK